jgi:hypothetical protein
LVDTPPPPLSVVIPTVRGRKALEQCLRSLLPQAHDTCTELIVMDGSDESAPHDDADPGVTWIRVRGAGIFDLRARGLELARGTLVALTEDHCVVAPDLCRAILRAHAEAPEALVVKGIVGNGTDVHLVDRASFLLGHLPHLSPLDAGSYSRVFGVGCTSFKRPALDLVRAEVGKLYPELASDSWRPIGRVKGDERLRVTHLQSEGWVGTVALQFHNARAVAGLRGSRPSARDRLRLIGAPVLAWIRTVRVVGESRRKGVPWRTVMSCAPVWLALLHVKAAGDIAGYLLGPGDSGRRIQ